MTFHEWFYGWFGLYRDNDVSLQARDLADPVGFRIGAEHGKTLGWIGFDRIIQDGEQKRPSNARVQLIAHEEENGQVDVELFLYDPSRPGGDDAKTVKVARWDTQGGSTTPTPEPSNTSRFFSVNKKFCTIIQDDGHMVMYWTHNSTDESTWTAIWSNWNGLMVPPPYEE